MAAPFILRAPASICAPLARVCLRRLPRCARAEDGGACGDEQAAGEGEQEQQAA